MGTQRGRGGWAGGGGEGNAGQGFARRLGPAAASDACFVDKQGPFVDRQGRLPPRADGGMARPEICCAC